MDGENNGKPYCLMDDLGFSPIFGNIEVVFETRSFSTTPRPQVALEPFGLFQHSLVVTMWSMLFAN